MNIFEYFASTYWPDSIAMRLIYTNIILAVFVAIVHMLPVFDKSGIKKFLLCFVIDSLAIIALYTIIDVAANYLQYTFEQHIFSQINRYGTWLLICVLNAFIPTTKKYFLRLNYSIMTASLIFFAILITSNIGGLIDWVINLTLWTLIAFCIIFIIFIKAFNLSEFRYVKNSHVNMLSVEYLCLYVIVVIFNELEVFGVSTILVTSLTFVSVFVAYISFYYNCKNYNDIIELQVKRVKEEAEGHQIALTEYQYYELKKIRHDFKNHLGVLSQCIENGNYEGLKKYFADIYEESLLPLSYIETGNNTCNSILNMEINKAKSQNINVRTSIVVPKDLSDIINDYELTSLLSNILDNAIEAASSIAGEKCIDIEMSSTENSLLITVINDLKPGYDKSKVLSLKSSKKQRMYHGYGTKIIKDISNEHNGYVSYSIEHDRFICKVLVNKIEEEV